jgi:hypothetical protein
MGRPVIDDEWTFGSDDETLFKLIRAEEAQPLYGEPRGDQGRAATLLFVWL